MTVSLQMEAVMGERRTAESVLERGLFASRWLMAPMYLGLVVALLMLLVIFFRELAYYVPQMLTLSPEKTILVVLTLIDLTLAANLLLIVMFSGYESFVSKFDFDPGTDRPGWMGKVDFGGLKMKLIASIVAISAIHLLKRFMEIGDPDLPAPSEGHLFWLTVIHMTFVLSGVLMALMDWLQARSAK
ncbi:TIGR00645 family protein [Paragemmobacter kunshanensis]|nr:TIGR00645 family protein [Rhodobacter kunshanensis]